MTDNTRPPKSAASDVEIVLILLDGVVQFDRSDLGVEGVVDPFRRIIDISGSVFHQVRGLAHDEVDHHADEDSPQTEDDEKADESCSTSLPARLASRLTTGSRAKDKNSEMIKIRRRLSRRSRIPPRHQEHCDRNAIATTARQNHAATADHQRTSRSRSGRECPRKLVSAAFAVLCGSPVSAGVGVDRVRLSG